MFETNVFGIKSLFMPCEDPVAAHFGGAGGGGGAGVDADAVNGTPVATDANLQVPQAGADPNAQPGAEPGTQTPPAGDEEPFSLQYGDRKLTEEEIVDAIKALDERKDWQGKLHAEKQQIMAMAQSLEAERQRLLGGGQPNQPPPGAQPGQPQPGSPYHNPDGSTTITGEQFRDMLFDKPTEAMKYVGGMIQSAVNFTVNEAVNAAFNKHDTRTMAKSHFEGQFPDYNDTVQSPEFQQFYNGLPTDGQGNPLYNKVNAYFAYKLNSLSAQVAEAQKLGFKAGQEDTRKNLKASGNFKLLRGAGARPSAPQRSVKDMSDAERNVAAVENLLKMREAGGGQ